MTINELIQTLLEFKLAHGGELPVYVNNEPYTLEAECSGAKVLRGETLDANEDGWEFAPKPARLYLKT